VASASVPAPPFLAPSCPLSSSPERIVRSKIVVNPLRHWLVQTLCAGCISVSLSLAGDENHTLVTSVRSLADGEAIAGAIVFVHETGDRMVSDSAGMCVLGRLREGAYTLMVHHIGFRDVEIRIVIGPETPDSVSIRMQASPFRTGEVLARSTLTDASISSTPFPMEIQQADKLSSLRPVSVPDVASTAPGVALARDGSWETSIVIRGLDQAHVVSTIDGVRIESATDLAGVLSLMNLNDIDRIETIKTSGSVMYGTGAIGGVLAVTTKKPAFSDQARFHGEEVTGASSVDNGVSQYVAIDGESQSVAARVSGGFRRAGNTRTPSGILQNSQYHDFDLSGTLLVRSVGTQMLELSYQRAQAEDAGIPGGSPFSGNAVATYTLARRELFKAEYRIPNPVPNVGMVSMTASHQEIDRNVSVVQSPTLTLTPHAIHATNSVGTYAVLSPWEDDILAVGIDVWQRSLESRREKHNLAAMTITGERPVPASKFLSAGAYAQNEWRIGQTPAALVVGARYDAIQVSNDASWNPEYVVRINGGQPVPTPQQLLWPASYEKNASWSVNGGFKTEVTSLIDASFLIGTAYRSPSLEERFQYLDLGSVVQVGNPALQPERSVSLNLGAQLHDAAFTTRLDLFFNTLHDLVSSLPGTFEGRPALVNANIGSARLFGGEASAEVTLSGQSGVRASVAYVRGQDTRSRTNLTRIPPLLARVEYRQGFHALGTVVASLAGAARKADPGPGELRIPGFCCVGCEYSTNPFEVGGLSLVLRAGIENLLDQDYQDFLSTLRGVVRSEPGRNVYAALSASI